MERLNKIRFYAPMYLLAAGLAFGSPSITAYAEEESVTTESTASADEQSETKEVTTSSEEEVLYEETEDNYETEDIPDESQKSDEQKAAEEAAQKAAEEEAQKAAEEARKEAERIEEEKKQQEAIIGSTDIDPEDEEYNTGRKEIPDTVKTEAERKGIDRIPGKPGKPGDKEKTGNPGSSETTTETTETTVITEIPITPKTGLSLGGIILAGGGLGVALGATNNLVSQIQMNKVVDSKKKFRRKSKKRTRK